MCHVTKMMALAFIILVSCSTCAPCLNTDFSKHTVIVVLNDWHLSILFMLLHFLHLLVSSFTPLPPYLSLQISVMHITGRCITFLLATFRYKYFQNINKAIYLLTVNRTTNHVNVVNQFKWRANLGL